MFFLKKSSSNNNKQIDKHSNPQKIDKQFITISPWDFLFRSFLGHLLNLNRPKPIGDPMGADGTLDTEMCVRLVAQWCFPKTRAVATDPAS